MGFICDSTLKKSFIPFVVVVVVVVMVMSYVGHVYAIASVRLSIFHLL